MNRVLVSLLLMVLTTSAFAQDQYEKKNFGELNYRILWPDNFDKSKKYPVVLFLHGAGERGSDNEKQLVHGSQLFIDAQSKFPSIVIFPQCPKEDYWAKVDVTRDAVGNRTFNFTPKEKPTPAMQKVIALMDSVQKLDFVNKEQIYVGGLSMGGMGTFEILYREPKMFAAAFAICGGGNPLIAKKIARNVDMWVFHGGKDDIVPPAYSETMVEAIEEKGGEVKFTLYPEANHNSWDSTFAEPDLLPWLFSKRN